MTKHYNHSTERNLKSSLLDNWSIGFTNSEMLVQLTFHTYQSSELMFRLLYLADILQRMNKSLIIIVGVRHLRCGVGHLGNEPSACQLKKCTSHRSYRMPKISIGIQTEERFVLLLIIISVYLYMIKIKTTG